MNTPNKQTIACYIDSNKILFYQETTGSILQLEFPPEVFSYLDLLSEDKFEQLIKLFLDQNKITGGNVILVYSPTSTFEKDFQELDDGKQDMEIQKFTDMVPFEDVLSKTYKLKKKVKVVAVNNRVYESIRSVLENSKFLIYAVIPGSILQENVPELAENIDLGFILNRIDSLKQYSMINRNAVSNQELEKKPEAKKTNKRIYALGGVFGVLFIILAIMIFNGLSPEDNTKKSDAIDTLQILPKPSIIETSEHNNEIPEIIDTSATPSGTIVPQ